MYSPKLFAGNVLLSFLQIREYVLKEKATINISRFLGMDGTKPRGKIIVDGVTGSSRRCGGAGMFWYDGSELCGRVLVFSYCR
jgi:hypothetical protein